MINRIYIIQYNVEMYTINNIPVDMSIRKEVFYTDERDNFIKRYTELKEKWYITNMVCYYGNLQELDDKAMTEIIDAV